jgi:hypothetical protein
VRNCFLCVGLANGHLRYQAIHFPGFTHCKVYKKVQIQNIFHQPLLLHCRFLNPLTHTSNPYVPTALTLKHSVSWPHSTYTFHMTFTKICNHFLRCINLLVFVMEMPNVYSGAQNGFLNICYSKLVPGRANPSTYLAQGNFLSQL